MKTTENNIILKLSIEFAVKIIDYTEKLEEKRKFVVARQLLKSGTAIGANIREAQNAESQADFLHKVKIAAKEAEETDYWLTLCQLAENYPNVDHLKGRLDVILKIISKIIISTKSRINSK